MSAGQIKAIKFEVEYVGKKVKGTKRRYLWVLSIGQRVYNFVLDDSLLSGKSKLSINGRLFHQIEQGIGGCNYSHSFIVDQCLFNISFANDFYQMRVNNNTFSHYLALQRKKEEFQEHKVQESTFGFADFSKPAAQKKITISLPGMGNAMKKKKGPVVQTENWSAFCQPGSFNPFAAQTPNNPVPTSAPVQPIVEKAVVAQQQVKQNQPLQTQQTPSASDFNTMQDLFKTICTSKPYQKTVKEGQTPTYQLEEIPALPEINLQEFSTLQQLFATTSPVQLPSTTTPPTSSTPIASSVPPSLVAPKKQQIKFDDFNTMQQLFQTLKCNVPTSQQPATKQPIIKACDFNTMQQLFATNVAQTKVEVPPKLENLPLEKKTAFDQFHTIQCVFDEKSAGKFSTFTQNLALSSTNKLNTPQAEVKEEAVLKNEKGAEQKAKWDDFNTMQNLFKTNAVECKKQNQFWKF